MEAKDPERPHTTSPSFSCRSSVIYRRHISYEVYIAEVFGIIPVTHKILVENYNSKVDEETKVVSSVNVQQTKFIEENQQVDR